MDKPSHFHAMPGEILDWLRQNFAEDTLQRLYCHIGNNAVAEVMEDIRTIAKKNYIQTGHAETYAYDALMVMANYMDPKKGGGYYPSSFMCSKHTKCPGYPRCKGPQQS